MWRSYYYFFKNALVVVKIALVVKCGVHIIFFLKKWPRLVDNVKGNGDWGRARPRKLAAEVIRFICMGFTFHLSVSNILLEI